MKNISVELGSSGIGGSFLWGRWKVCLLMTSGWMKNPVCSSKDAPRKHRTCFRVLRCSVTRWRGINDFCRSSGGNGGTCRETDPTCIFHERQRLWKRYRWTRNRWTLFQNIMAAEEEESIKHEGKDTQRNFCWMERMCGGLRTLELHLGWLVVPGVIWLGRVNR